MRRSRTWAIAVGVVLTLPAWADPTLEESLKRLEQMKQRDQAPPVPIKEETLLLGTVVGSGGGGGTSRGLASPEHPDRIVAILNSRAVSPVFRPRDGRLLYIVPGQTNVLKVRPREVLEDSSGGSDQIVPTPGCEGLPGASVGWAGFDAADGTFYYACRGWDSSVKETYGALFREDGERISFGANAGLAALYAAPSRGKWMGWGEVGAGKMGLVVYDPRARAVTAVAFPLGIKMAVQAVRAQPSGFWVVASPRKADGWGRATELWEVDAAGRARKRGIYANVPAVGPGTDLPGPRRYALQANGELDVQSGDTIGRHSFETVRVLYDRKEWAKKGTTFVASDSSSELVLGASMQSVFRYSDD